MEWWLPLTDTVSSDSSTNFLFCGFCINLYFNNKHFSKWWTCAFVLLVWTSSAESPWGSFYPSWALVFTTLKCRSWYSHIHRFVLRISLDQFSKEEGFPSDSLVKNPQANAGRGFHPWMEKIPRRKWQPTPVFLPGKSHGQSSLAGYSPWGRKGSDLTECNNFQREACPAQ